MEKKQLIDTKIKFLYETFSQQSDIYYEPILEAYYRVFVDNDKFTIEDLKKVHHSPAEIIDDLAMVMYEVENEAKQDE